MRFFLYAPHQDEQQMTKIRKYKLPYDKTIVGVDGKDLRQAREGDVIAIFGHGREARAGSLEDYVRSIHNYSLWGSENNPFNEDAPPTRFDTLPITFSKLGLKPARYTFFFNVCFAGQDSLDKSDWEAWKNLSEKNRWKPNIEVFGDFLVAEGRAFAGSTVFGPTGLIWGELSFFGKYHTVDHGTWVWSDRKEERCRDRLKEVSLLVAKEIPGVLTKRTVPEKTIAENFFGPGGFTPKK
jgi:hypothetical protein